MNTWRTSKLKKLSAAILGLETAGEVRNFLRDLCTLDELEELSTRWEIAQMLHKGLPYREVAEKTKVSTTTVTRIAYWLEHGEGGYQIALKNIKNKR